MARQSDTNRRRRRETFTLHPDVKEQLRELAEDSGRSMSLQLEHMIGIAHRELEREVEGTVALAQSADADGTGSRREEPHGC